LTIFCPVYFFPFYLLPNYFRSEAALVAGMVEMVVNGVSTRFFSKAMLVYIKYTYKYFLSFLQNKMFLIENPSFS